MRGDQTFVIVGASLAGATAAETLRAEGCDGRVVLLEAERLRPCERPPLSKDYLRGESEAEEAHVHPESLCADRDVELQPGTAAEAIDPDADEVVRDGQVIQGPAKRSLDVKRIEPSATGAST